MALGSIIMAMDGMVDVVSAAEVVAVQEAVFTRVEDEDMEASQVDMAKRVDMVSRVDTASQVDMASQVDTMTMVNWRHHLPKDVVSMQNSQF